MLFSKFQATAAFAEDKVEKFKGIWLFMQLIVSLIGNESWPKV